MTDSRHRFFDLAASADVDGALDMADELVDAGLTPARIIAEVIVPTQIEVGRLWENNVWSVAQEHAATAVVDAVVGRLALLRQRRRSERGRIAVLCAEGEWHTLAARLVSVALRAEGWSVVFLGGSVPAPQLTTAAHTGGWDAAVVTCSVAMFLPGAQRSIAALHASGLPVLATGRGFGRDPGRAMRTGADAWSAGPEDGIVILDRWSSSPPPRLASATTPREAAMLEADLSALGRGVTALVQQLWGRARDLTGTGDLEADVLTLLRFLHAAVATDDADVLTEFLPWLREVVASRDLPGDTVRDLVEAVDTALPAELSRTRELLRSAG